MCVACGEEKATCSRQLSLRERRISASRSFERILLDARLRAVSSVQCCEKRLHLFMASVASQVP